jgi:hypothetical protein
LRIDDHVGQALREPLGLRSVWSSLAPGSPLGKCRQHRQAAAVTENLLASTVVRE